MRDFNILYGQSSFKTLTLFGSARQNPSAQISVRQFAGEIQMSIIFGT